MKYPNSIFIDDDILNMLRGITNQDLTCAMEMRKCKDDYDTTMASKRSLVGLKDVYVSLESDIFCIDYEKKLSETLNMMYSSKNTPLDRIRRKYMTGY